LSIGGATTLATAGFHEYAIDTARACKELGIKAVAVTAGYITPLARNEFICWIEDAKREETCLHSIFGLHSARR
jgi:dihydrodipicolinate synthase/N-acetylneuraminate lyase